MRTICKLLPLFLLASAVSLSSCVNEVKNPPKTQVQDSVAIIYNIPDSNKILTVDFHAVMTPPWQKNYRIDWNFGDSTGVISKFDTINLSHNYQKSGSYLVTLSVFDTVSKNFLGKTSVQLDLKDNAIDTNFLQQFAKISVAFIALSEFHYSTLSQNQNDSLSDIISISIPDIKWIGNKFQAIFDSNFSSTLGGRYPGYYSYQKRYILNGYISPNGRSIDSCNYFYNYYEASIYSPVAVGTTGYGQNVNFIFANLKSTLITNDSIVFSINGIDVQSKIINIRDSITNIYWTFGNNYYQQNSYKLINILWDHQPSPILTVKLYK